MINWIKQNIWNVLIWGSVVFFTALYISLLFNQNVFTDEIYTLQLIKNDFRGIVYGTSVDVHPPLYYFVAKIAQLVFGEGLLIQKIVPLVPMSLTLVIGATKVRRLFSDSVSLLFIVILGCIPCSMEFAVQVRMYSMSLLAVTVCGLYAYECYMTEKKGVWIGLVLSAVAAAYLHYYAFVSVISICGMLFLTFVIFHRKKLKIWLLAAVAMIALYLPWFHVLLKQFSKVSKSYWIPEITGDTILGYFKWTFGIHKWDWPCYTFILLSVFAGIAVLTGVLHKQKDDIFALLCMLVPTLVTTTGVVLSLIFRPIYREQYVFPAIGLFCLFLAIALSRFVQEKWILVIGPICLFILFEGAVQYLETWRQEYKSTLTDQTVDFWNANVGENDIIVYNWEVFRMCYAYYFPEEKLFYVRDVDLTQDFDTIWFIDTYNQWDFIPNQIEIYDLQIIYQGHFGIEHNEFDLYKVTKGPNALY